MFIYKKINKSGSTTVQIIHKFQRENRIIKTIGTSFDNKEIDKFYRIAQSTIPKIFNQLTLFDDSIDNKTSIIEELSNDDIKIVGPELIFGRIFNHIGFDNIPDELFKDLAISRITHPGSKLKLSEYLQENGKQKISVDNIYRFLDKLNAKYKYQVEDISFAHTNKILAACRTLKILIFFYL